jgi:hypothetical protein
MPFSVEDDLGALHSPGLQKRGGNRESTSTAKPVPFPRFFFDSDGHWTDSDSQPRALCGFQRGLSV